MRWKNLLLIALVVAILGALLGYVADLYFTHLSNQTPITNGEDAYNVLRDIIIVVIAEKDLHFEKSRMWEMLSYEICWEKMVSNNKEQANKFLKNRMKLKFNTTINNILT